MGKPFVSVLIDTYNHERFIEQAIVSVLEQDFPASDREILVVDDGSTDRTPEIIGKFGPQVRLLRKGNGGQASAFNAGIPECCGEIIAFLDGDDWWEKPKLSVVSSELAAYPEIGTIGHGLYEVDESGKMLAWNTPDHLYETRLKDTQQATEFIPLRSFLGTSRLTVRRRILQCVTPLPEALRVEADELLATHATAVSGARVLQQALTNYRLHSGNLYQFSEWSREKAKRKYDSLACLLRDLPPRLTKAGVPEGVIHLLTECVRIDVERLGLALGNGWPWDTVRVERQAGQQAYREATFGYHLFHAAVLGAAAVLPPALFYRMRRWYTKRGLARARQIVGSPKPIPSLVVRTHSQLMTRADSPTIPRWRSRLASLPPFSGKLRIINLAAATLRSIGRNEQKVCLWDGAEFCVDLRDRIQRQMWCGCYEPHVMRALRGILRDGDVFLDLGAHIGYHSYFAAGLVGSSGRVFAFEPDPENYLRLKKNLEAFPYAQAEQCAIWSHEGKLTFARSESTEESGWGALARVHNAPEREQIEVESVSLDAWTERSALKAIRAAKIDVEGSEFEVLQGARRVLHQMRPVLLFEMNESLLLQAGASAAAIKQLLRRHEYKLHTLLDGSLQPCRGMTASETIDFVAIPEESEESNLHEMSGLLRRKSEGM